MKFLSEINHFKGNGIRDEIEKMGKYLDSLDDDMLTPYLQLVRDEFEALTNLAQFGGSFDEMFKAYMDCRHSYDEVLADLREKHPDFNLFANRGQVPDTEKDSLDVLSFAVPGSVKSCLNNPDVTDAVDLMVRII